MSKGKFANDVAEYVYSLSLEGLGDEIGGRDYGLSHTRIEFDATTAAAVNDLLPEDEQHGRCVYFDEAERPNILCTGYWGAVLTEDSQGFVDVLLLETSMEADERWHSLLDEQAVA